MRKPLVCRAAAAVGLTAAAAACSPTYDWRDTVSPEAGLVALFPCKPVRVSRPVALPGVGPAPLVMLMLACQAGGSTFAISHLALADETQVTPALQALRQAAAANVGGAASRMAPLNVPGMTPSPLAERLLIEGATQRMQAGFFTAGSHVYQATVVGATLDAEAADTFFDGLKRPP